MGMTMRKHTYCHTHTYIIMLTQFIGNHMPNFSLVSPLIAFDNKMTSWGWLSSFLYDRSLISFWQPKQVHVGVTLTEPHPLLPHKWSLTFINSLVVHMSNF